MNTIPEQQGRGRRRRRAHSEEFKADAVAACTQPGISMAAVAMERGVNANLLRRWVREAEMKPAGQVQVHDTKLAAVATPAKPEFVPMTIPAPASTQGIRVELRRGAMSATVTWPQDSAGDCATWLRELLR